MTPITQNSPVLVVDLDGTLVATDLLVESFIRLLIEKWYLIPWFILVIPFVFLTKGKSGIKVYFANRIQIDPQNLPYRQEVLEYLREARRNGTRLILASAAAQSFVTKINEHLRLFEAVYGTTEGNNLKGKHKLAQILKITNGQDFDYIGDTKADLPIWKQAKNKFVVSSRLGFASLLRRESDLIHLVICHEAKWQLVIKALRIHQWAKNLLLIVPALTAHKWNDSLALADIVVGFFSFSAVASAVYVLNDLADLDSDRLHRTKKHRPFASGDLPLIVGALLVPILLIIGIGLASVISSSFLSVVVGYLILTTLYSFWLKRIALIDILTLASLYTLRLFAGAAIVTAPISQWLAAFSMFIFFSLAALKRFVEVADARRVDKKEIKGRGYSPDDLEVISHFGITSGLVAVLVLALYVNSSEVVSLYTLPHRLWALCPLFFYWIARLWLKASRHQMHEDPILFAIRDPGSLLTGLLVVASVIVSL
jgi:4-hydroxybenzoate polyprenyltransferase